MAQKLLAADLVGLSGPGEGLRAELDPDAPLRIGRTLAGLEVPDPLVSLEHAVIAWDGTHFAITDLGSISGTEIEGAKITPKEPVRITIGTRITIGGSVFEVVERHRALRRMAEVGLLGAMGLVILCAGVYAVAPRRDAGVAMMWPEPIAQGARSDRQLALDLGFLRQRGVNPRELRIRRVTDFDRDDVAEVWLTAGDREQVISFEADGHWVDLGSVAAGCADVKGSGPGLPMLECGALTYAVLEAGRYEAMRQDGAVVWAVPAAAWKQQGPPPPELVKVYRAAVRRPTGLAGLLAANGVDRPVHYVVCEDAIAKLPALAVVEGGGVVPFSQGCGRMVQVAGFEAAGGARAMAFTAVGHRALLDDLAVHLAGSPDGLFVEPAQEAVIRAWRATPAPLGAAWVGFDAVDHFFAPIAVEGPLNGARRWSAASARPVTSTTLVAQGTTRLDPPGCAVLEVTVGPWNCPVVQRCVEGSTFLQVRDVGCGEPADLLTATYASGAVAATHGDLEVRARVDAVPGDGKIDVLRAVVGWRPTGG